MVLNSFPVAAFLVLFRLRLLATPVYDITRRIQAEKALKETEGRFRNIFAEVPIGMAIVDLEDHVLQVNKAFCEMLGYEEEELLGRIGGDNLAKFP